MKSVLCASLLLYCLVLLILRFLVAFCLFWELFFVIFGWFFALAFEFCACDCVLILKILRENGVFAFVGFGRYYSFLPDTFS